MSSYIEYYKYRILELIMKHAWILDGDETSTNKPLKILYIGNEKNKNYIKKITFNDKCNEVYLGKKFFGNLYYILRKNRYKCSLAIIEGKAIEQHLFGAMKDFFVPLWLENIASLPLKAKHNAAKQDLRILKKNKLEYIVSKDPELLDDFYYNMHIPMIQARYKTGAFEVSYDDMMKKIKENCYELILIKKEDIFISGVLLHPCKGIPRLWKNGIRDFEYRNDGAIAATYVYASDYLHKKGSEKVSFGLTRGFLNDGVLYYKRRWDVVLKISDDSGYILKPLIISDGLKGFFENNPFIYREKDKLYGAVFIDENEEYCDEDCRKFQKKYDSEGLSELNIFSIRESKTIQRSKCIRKC